MKANFARRRARPSYRRNPPRGPRGEVDSAAAVELFHYIVSDGDLYRRQTTPIIANLKKKKAKGVYDAAKVVKLFMYLATSGAQKYAKENGMSLSDFNVPTRTMTARKLADYYQDEIAYKPNPARGSLKQRADAAYYAAMKADEAFHAALKKQFGKRAAEARYRVGSAGYNATTKRAYERFRRATAALRAYWDRLRKAR